MKVLIVEDEERIASFLVKGLTGHGYDAVHASSGAEALARAAAADVILLDLGLPDADGLDVLEAIRRSSPDAQIIVVTARAEIGDRVEGLERGADDYLVKPFAFDELLARVRARVRALEVSERRAVSFAGIDLDLIDRRATVGERRIDLSAREFDVLRLLIAAGGEVVDRYELLSRVWGYEDFEPRSNPVEVYVSSLRKKVGRDRIETVRGHGYRLRTSASAGTRTHARTRRS
ncbi:MAG TPA: response regulator transcription factor [Actinomycetota bacterium]|nr:response regulator transcription factor [Actinomycetota bacterium]